MPRCRVGSRDASGHEGRYLRRTWRTSRFYPFLPQHSIVPHPQSQHKQITALSPDAEKPESLTTKYLTGIEKIEVPSQRRKWSNYIEIVGARENNLKNVSVKFPLNTMTVVTGVSGSGKSTLINDTLHRLAAQELYDSSTAPAPYEKAENLQKFK